MTKEETELSGKLLRAQGHIMQISEILKEHIGIVGSLVARIEKLEAVVEGMAVGKRAGSS